jgi:phage terminase large subunit-like protein
MNTPTQINPTVDAYIAGVLDGSVVVGPWIKKAIQRHINDLKRTDMFFDVDAANYVIDFVQEFCIPPNQEEPLQLYPAQQVWLAIVYGWKRLDGYRRFRRTFWFVSKKNGKSALSAALCLYHLIADGEKSARVFCAATNMKQARTVFKEAASMSQRHADLKKRIHQSGNEPVIALWTNSMSRLSPMARSADSEDGAVVSACVIDELHRIKDYGLWTVLQLGGRTRNQPLMICISTAGSSAGKTTICWDEYDYGCKILDGIITDDEVMPWFFTLDPKDNWKDSKNWVKSNPAIGNLFSLETIEKEFAEAQGKPTILGNFKRFSLNIWSDLSAEPAIDIDKWDDCCREDVSTYPDARRLRSESLQELKGRTCFAAIDLAPKRDTTALVLVFPPLKATEKWRIIEYFWCPADDVEERVQRDKVPYDLWSDQKFITLTLGNLTDVRYIAEQITEISKLFDLKEIAYDDAWSSELVRMLGESGFDMRKFVSYPQTFNKMNVPCRELELKILRQEFAHDRNPVMRWQMSNLRWNVQKGSNFIRPAKDRKREKIDGCSSLVMALGRAIDPDNVVKPKTGFFMVTSKG